MRPFCICLVTRIHHIWVLSVWLHFDKKKLLLKILNPGQRRQGPSSCKIRLPFSFLSTILTFKIYSHFRQGGGPWIQWKIPSSAPIGNRFYCCATISYPIKNCTVIMCELGQLFYQTLKRGCVIMSIDQVNIKVFLSSVWILLKSVVKLKIMNSLKLYNNCVAWYNISCIKNIRIRCKKITSQKSE